MHLLNPFTYKTNREKLDPESRGDRDGREEDLVSESGGWITSFLTVLLILEGGN